MIFLKHLVIALVTAIFATYPYYKRFLDTDNRINYQWGSADSCILLSVILCLAGGFLVAHALFGKTRLRRLERTAFVGLMSLCFGFALLDSMKVPIPVAGGVAGMVALALAITTWWVPRWEIPRKISALALIMSPLVLILAIQFATFPFSDFPKETLAFTHPPAPKNPVIILIFDEWSYERTFVNGELPESFRNLRALSGESFFFRQAISGGPRTRYSLPRFFYQTTDPVVVDGSGAFFIHESQKEPMHERESLFAMARKNGYNTFLVGFHLPERLILGDQADYIDSPGYIRKPTGLIDFIRFHALKVADVVLNRVHRSGWISLSPGSLEKIQYRNHLNYQHTIELLDGIKAQGAKILHEPYPNLFLVLHYPVPHPPSIFSAQGEYRGALAEGIKGYTESLGYVDKLAGEVVGLLKQSGKYDDALLIVTSDHSLRKDHSYKEYLAEAEAVRHVPLWIKLPHQDKAVDVTEKVYHTNLKPFFEAVFEGRLKDAYAYMERELPGKPARPPGGVASQPSGSSTPSPTASAAAGS